MTEKPLVSIGLVTWNSADSLQECLDGLLEQEYSNVELLVVDNASTDHSLKIIQDRYPNCWIMKNQENRGYCGAHNQAIRESQGAYYLALNPDVVMKPDYVLRMVEALEENPECGSASGKLWQSSGGTTPNIIDTTGLFINRHRRQYLRGHGEEDQGQYDSGGEIFGVDGAAPLYRRAMLEDIQVDGQYFDEQFFAHKEDVDLAWRGKLFGWRCWYEPRANAIHPRSFRPGKRKPIASEVRTLAVKNRYLLLIKNESKAGWRRDAIRIASYDLQIIIYILLFERQSLAAFQLLREQWPVARAWREKIWRRVKVSSTEILTWFS